MASLPAARLSVPVQRPRTAPVAQPVPEDEPASSTSAMRRTNSQQGLLNQALTMSDDLSALVSSLRRNRSRDADESPVNAHAWLEQVLDAIYFGHHCAFPLLSVQK